MIRSGNRAHLKFSHVFEVGSKVEKLFEQWVKKEGGEGLVIRNETAGIFKVKPLHTLDAVVVGFTESINEREGLLHDLLLAVRRADGTFQILTRVGGGFSEDERRVFLSDLKDITADAPITDKADEGETVTIAAVFTDVGTLDTHTASIDWGDGTVTDGPVTRWERATVF